MVVISCHGLERYVITTDYKKINRAAELEDNLKMEQLQNQYDGLVVIFSGHGVDRFIITSDPKSVSKVAIHCIFSAKKPLIRKIPRIFWFDCYSGNRERVCAHSRESIIGDQGKSIISVEYEDDQDEVGKNTQMDDIVNRNKYFFR